MGSGTFPLDRDDAYAIKLLKAASLIGEVLAAVDPWEADQTDNAASDGGSFALLSLAQKLIEDEVLRAK